MRKIMIMLYSLAITGLIRAEESPKRIRFGETGGTNVSSVGGKPAGIGLVALANHLGYFETEFGKNGPKAEQIFFAGTGPAQNEAMAQGDIEFGTWGGVPNVIGLTGGIPAKIVAVLRSSGSGNNYHIAVKPNSSIHTVDDLRGKRIAVSRGTNPYQSLVLLLEANGIPASEVTLVNLTGSEALVAIQADGVDAVFGGANFFILRDQGKLRLLEGLKTHRQAQSVSGFIVNTRFAQKHPELVRRVVKVLTKTAHWASQEDNREALIQFISSRSLSYKYTAEDFALTPLIERYNPTIDESTFEAYKRIVAFAVKHKLIRKAPPEATIRSWFDPSYQQAALKELGIENFWKNAEYAGPVTAALAR
jgi:sulfonate transport system substrate-binding protein